MGEPIFITGAGIISAIGNNKKEVLDSLLNERSGIAPLKYLKTDHKEFPVGEVKLSNEQMVSLLDIDENQPVTRTALMGMLALKEALAEAEISCDMLGNIAFISGTTVGGMDMSEQFYADFLSNNSKNTYIATHDCGASSQMIADHFGTFESMTTISTACSSAANAIILGADLIRSGRNDIVVVGGSECITKFHLNGFNSLMILDREICRPFDSTRAGLNLGEGAAYIVMESGRSFNRRRGLIPGLKAMAVLRGYSNRCDAYHQTASSDNGEGAYLAMRGAIEDAGLSINDIDYINAHGTGTQNNDLSESTAMIRLFGEKLPAFSSTKSFTGHTTSASGSIEAIISILAIQNDFYPVNFNFKSPLENGAVPVSPETLSGGGISGKIINNVLCNSFGFGGNDSSLLISDISTVGLDVSGACNTCDSGCGNLCTASVSVSESAGEAIYVSSVKQISIQKPLQDEWVNEAVLPDGQYCRAIDPVFKEYLAPNQARRLGKLLGRALVTSIEALNEAGIDHPDAIITGTGLGCIENTEMFLNALTFEGEQFLKPTYFMQSTHNTISSLIAINTGSHGYNSTYAHRSISFDSALHDAFLQFKLGKIDSALVGSNDELTPSYFNLLQKIGFVGVDDEVSGEVSVSAILTKDASKAVCELSYCDILYSPSIGRLKSELDGLLGRFGLKLSDIDAVMTGISGNKVNDKGYYDVVGELFGSVPLLRYKHIFGESYSSSALGFYAAVTCLKNRCVPDILLLDGVVSEPKNILLFNYSDSKNYSFVLLRSVCLR